MTAPRTTVTPDAIPPLDHQALRTSLADNPTTIAALDIHHPEVTDYAGHVTCANGCGLYEDYAEPWPCGTYTAIKDAA